MISLQDTQEAGEQAWKTLTVLQPAAVCTQTTSWPITELAKYQLEELHMSEHLDRRVAMSTMVQFWEEFLIAMASKQLPPHIGSAEVSTLTILCYGCTARTA